MNENYDLTKDLTGGEYDEVAMDTNDGEYSDASQNETSDEEVNESYDDPSDESVDDSDRSFFSENDDCESSGGVDKTPSAVLMILAFFLRHNLTWVALEHLLQLINGISPGAVPTSKYLFSKLLPSTQKPTYHYYCRKCCLYLGKKDDIIQTYGGCDIKCENCEYEFSLKKRHQCSFFIVLNLKSQIENIVQKYKQHFNSPNVDEAVNDISDINCGNIYKTLKNKYKNLISLTFNTDGVKIINREKIRRSGPSKW